MAESLEEQNNLPEKTDPKEDEDGIASEKSVEMTKSAQIEMETMNTTAYCVNELSKALDMERKRYQSYLARVVQTVEKRRKECQRQLERSEPFFKVLKEVRELQFRSRTAAARYEAASQKHHAAKMKVAMAERQLEERLQCGESGNPVLDEAWQETLANGVEQVNETEKTKREHEGEHLRLTEMLAVVVERCHILEKKNRKDIKKANAFYMENNMYKQKIKEMRLEIGRLEGDLITARKKYEGALKSLEVISNTIHMKRQTNDVRKRTLTEEVRDLETEAKMVGIDCVDGTSGDEYDYSSYDPPFGEGDSLESSETSSIHPDAEDSAQQSDPLEMKQLQKQLHKIETSQQSPMPETDGCDATHLEDVDSATTSVLEALQQEHTVGPGDPQVNPHDPTGEVTPESEDTVEPEQTAPESRTSKLVEPRPPSPSLHESEPLEENESGRSLEENELGRSLEENGSGHSLEENGSGRTLEENELGRSLEENELGCSLEENELGCSLEENELGCSLEENELGCSLEENELGCSLEENELGCSLEENELGRSLEENELVDRGLILVNGTEEDGEGNTVPVPNSSNEGNTDSAAGEISKGEYSVTGPTGESELNNVVNSTF